MIEIKTLRNYILYDANYNDKHSLKSGKNGWILFHVTELKDTRDGESSLPIVGWAGCFPGGFRWEIKVKWKMWMFTLTLFLK